MNRQPLEKMGDFFNRRIDGYEEHQKKYGDGGEELYAVTAAFLPSAPGAEILDLGCGTGLELDVYFQKNPTAAVTGIDLADRLTDELLRALYRKVRYSTAEPTDEEVARARTLFAQLTQEENLASNRAEGESS